MSTIEEDFTTLREAYGSHLRVAAILGMDGRHYRRVRAGEHKNKWTLQAISEAAARVRASQPLPATAQPQEAQP